MDITLEHISKSFDKKNKVIDDLSVTFKDGELTTLLGFSGCGKTTLLRMITGLETPEEGRILFGDKVLFDKKNKIDLAPQERGAAFVFQDFALWPNMTVKKNVSFAVSSLLEEPKLGKNYLQESKKRKEEIERRTEEALQMVNMEEYASRLPSELSGGQKQRVAIARAIATHPQMILFDEPLSALDALLREKMRGEIRELVKKLKMTAIFVTHDQAEAMAISDRIFVMSKGRVEEASSPKEIYWHPESKFVAEFLGKASWLSDTDFLRPEDITLTPSENAIEVKVKLLDSQLQGGSYFSKASDGEKTYLFYDGTERKIGDEFSLYYSKENVRHVIR